MIRRWRIALAAIAHLAHSTLLELLFSATDFNSYVMGSIADGELKRRLAARHHPASYRQH